MNAEYVENNIETLWETVQDLQLQIGVLRREIGVLNESQSSAENAAMASMGKEHKRCDHGVILGTGCQICNTLNPPVTVTHYSPCAPSETPDRADAEDAPSVTTKEAGNNINAIPQTQDGTVTNGEVAASPAVSLVESTARLMSEPERDPFCAWWEANKNDPNGVENLDMYTAQIAFAEGRRCASHDTD